MEKYESKTYISFVLILVFMMVSSMGLPIFLNGRVSSSIFIKIVYLDISLVMWYMSWVIYRKERIYWINNFTYKQAAEMDPEERKRISKLFFDTFGRGCLLIAVCMSIAFIIKTPFWIDLIILIIGFLAAGISFNIKLTKKVDE
ncbi:MAG: hypothetical protein JEZ08_03705 [Clostridiales bacterium]|nr:hypothetical protein [Clostridiales bacterium]